jgi:multiple sugar transport system ATP-binding protein
MKQDKTLTIKEVAGFLNISNQMVYNLIRDRKIEAFKVGSAIRILYSDLQSYIDEQKKLFHRDSEAIENSDENIFMVSGLNYKREEFQLTDISFSLPRGKILTILGQSGSGKTMMMKAIAGINKPESGSVFFGSDRLDLKDAADRNIGFVFEDYALMPNRSGRGNIRFPLELQKKKKVEIDPAVEKMAEELQISRGDLDTLIARLPEGIKQLIAIARAEVRNIDLLLMDEPLARLDKIERLNMRVFLKKLVTELQKTTIVTLHDPETALALGDYLGLIDGGRLIQFGEALDVYNNPVSETAYSLTSRFGCNTLDVSVSGGMVESLNLSTGGEDGDRRLVFRAEEIRRSDPGTGLPVQIRERHVLDGNRVQALCSSDYGDLNLILPTDSPDELLITPTRYGLFG